MGEPDDATELLRRVADGDDEALREFYRRHSRLAYLLAFRILGREELAEDAVQEAFLRLWRNAHRFRPERGSFTTWFGRVVRNLCIDMLRQRDPLNRATTIADMENLLASDETPETLTLDRLVVREAFLRLPGEQSQVLEMAYFQGLTHREIAESLQIPEGTVKSRMRLGIEKLRRYLDGASAP